MIDPILQLDPTALSPSRVALLMAFVLGWVAWPAVEYLIHGILSHRYKTFVTPLHMAHHREPRAVLTSPYAWVPVTGEGWAVLAMALGMGLAGAAVLGVLVGFARYEYFHWRIHFDRPMSERERVLFEHHLAHHYCNARAYHGVTSRFWDRVFGTLPAHAERDYAKVRGREPLGRDYDTFFSYRPSFLMAYVRAALQRD